MKKLVLILLALVLCCSAAAAETAVTGKKLEAKDVELIGELNMFSVGQNRADYLADLDLNILSDGYYSISYKKDADTIAVREPEEGKYGTIGKDGKVIVPAQYDEMEALSSRWFAGITLEEATGDNYDYQTLLGEKKYYLVGSVDIWYGAEKVGTLTRSEYKSAKAYGDYLAVRSREDVYTFYNKAFEKSAAEVKYGDEYTEDSGVITHNGTNTPAFTAGCALTADEVKQTVWVTRDNKLLDLQGNELADLSGYRNCSYNSSNGLIAAYDQDGKRGLLDTTGAVMVPAQYDELGLYPEIALRTGWLDVVKDGKIGFVNVADHSEAGFEYQKSAARVKGSFVQIEDPKEGKILVTAFGEIPTRFAEAEPAYYAPYAVVKATADSPWTVINLKGEEVIPDMPEVRGAYSVTFSDDGSLILVCDKDYTYTLYTVTAND